MCFPLLRPSQCNRYQVYRREVFASLTPTMLLIVLLLSSQTQATKTILVEMLALREELSPIAPCKRWRTMHVRINNPDRAKPCACSTCVKVHLPALTTAVCLVETTQLLGNRTLEQIAKIVQTVQCVEITSLIEVVYGISSCICVDLL